MQPDIKSLQIQLTGFLDKDTAKFCKELWDLCLSAQQNPQGVAKELLEAKKLELIQEKVGFLFYQALLTCRSTRKKRPNRLASRKNRNEHAIEKWRKSDAGSAQIEAEDEAALAGALAGMETETSGTGTLTAAIAFESLGASSIRTSPVADLGLLGLPLAHVHAPHRRARPRADNALTAAEAGP